MKLAKEAIEYSKIFDIAITIFFAVALNPEWSSSHILWWGSLFFAFIMFILSRNFSFTMNITPFKIWYLLFLFVCLLSVFYAQNKESAIDIVKTLIVLLAVLFVIDEEIQNRLDLEKYMLIYMLASAAMMVYLILNINLRDFQLAQHGLADMGLWNGNDVGLKCAVFVIFFMYFFDSRKSLFTRLILLVGLIFALTLIYYTASRKALSMIVLGFAMYFYFKYPSKRFLLAFFSLFLIYIAYLFVLNVPTLYESVGWRIEGLLSFFNKEKQADSSTNLRMIYIKVGRDAFVQSPLVGYGIDNYRYINMQKTGHFTYSHNNFIEILVELGVIGFIVYYYYYLQLTVVFFKFYFKQKTSLILNTLAISFFLMLLLHIGLVTYNDIVQDIIILFFAKALQIHNDVLLLGEL